MNNGDGSYSSSWFGFFRDLGHRWIEHAQLGLLYVGYLPNPDHIYSPVHGWIHVKSDSSQGNSFWVYRFDNGLGWHYYDSNAGGWTYAAEDESWVFLGESEQ